MVTDDLYQKHTLTWGNPSVSSEITLRLAHRSHLFILETDQSPGGEDGSDMEELGNSLRTEGNLKNLSL